MLLLLSADDGVFFLRDVVVVSCSVSSINSLTPSVVTEHIRRAAVKDFSQWGAAASSLYILSLPVFSCVSIEKPISCELPAGTYSKAWRCIPDPEADKPRLHLARMSERERESVYMCASQGCHGRLYQCFWSTMLPCAPGPGCAGCGRGQPGSQPRDSLVIWQTFW